MIWSRRPLIVMARSNRYSETVFCTSSIFFPGKIFQLEAVADEQRIVAVGIVADQDRGRRNAGRRRHVERLHVGHGAGVDVPGHERIQRGSVVEPLDLDGDAVLVGPLPEDSGLVQVMVRSPAGVNRPAKVNVGFSRSRLTRERVAKKRPNHCRPRSEIVKRLRGRHDLTTSLSCGGLRPLSKSFYKPDLLLQ